MIRFWFEYFWKWFDSRLIRITFSRIDFDFIRIKIIVILPISDQLVFWFLAIHTWQLVFMSPVL